MILYRICRVLMGNKNNCTVIVQRLYFLESGVTDYFSLLYMQASCDTSMYTALTFLWPTKILSNKKYLLFSVVIYVDGLLFFLFILMIIGPDYGICKGQAPAS